MIKNITDLRYYHESDRLACNKSAKASLRAKILSFLAPDYISEFLRELRIVEYLSNCSNRGIMGRVFLFYHRLKLRKIQLHLGFSIPINVCDPGLSIAHYGSIIISSKAKIGRNCRILHASTLGQVEEKTVLP